MSDNKKENSSSAKIAAAIGTVIVAVLTAQNAPWWVSKLESIFGGNNKPSTPESSSPKPTSSALNTSTPTPIPTPTSTRTTVPLQPSALPSPSTQTPPFPVAERWRFMGVSTKTGEEMYVDNSSITNYSGTIRFTYKIGNDLIDARADCDANKWYAKNKNTGEDYGWISPQSQASQSMMNYVCK